MCVYVCVHTKLLCHVWLFATAWTVSCQALLSMEFPRQEYWTELPFTNSGDLPNPGIEPASLMSPALAGGFFTTGASGKARSEFHYSKNSQCSLFSLIAELTQSKDPSQIVSNNQRKSMLRFLLPSLNLSPTIASISQTSKPTLLRNPWPPFYKLSSPQNCYQPPSRSV